MISDLDWGQDMARLSTYLREHQVKHVSIASANSFDSEALGFPDTEYIACGGATPSGWVAVEERRVRVHRECYPWLGQQKLVALVGKTMKIYYVSPTPGLAPAITANSPENKSAPAALTSAKATN